MTPDKAHIFNIKLRAMLAPISIGAVAITGLILLLGWHVFWVSVVALLMLIVALRAVAAINDMFSYDPDDDDDDDEGDPPYPAHSGHMASVH